MSSSSSSSSCVLFERLWNPFGQPAKSRQVKMFYYVSSLGSENSIKPYPKNPFCLFTNLLQILILNSGIKLLGRSAHSEAMAWQGWRVRTGLVARKPVQNILIGRVPHWPFLYPRCSTGSPPTGGAYVHVGVSMWVCPCGCVHMGVCPCGCQPSIDGCPILHYISQQSYVAGMSLLYSLWCYVYSVLWFWKINRDSAKVFW
jgi:hypothetical protein